MAKSESRSGQRKIRWGIISTAQIGRNVFVPALRDTNRGEVVAVASRERDRADAYATELGIPQVFDSYEELLASDSVDAVYNPLPNTMHEQWTVRAAELGKHIFCEKPIAMDAASAQRMVDAAGQHGVLLFEAFVFRYHPQTLRLRRLLDDGAIGALRNVTMRMSFKLPAGPNIRWDPQLGGGAVYDVGSYAITFARWAFGSEPLRVAATWRIDPDAGVDAHVGMLLTFADDAIANLYTGFDGHGTPGALLIGDAGSLEIEAPTHPYEQSAYTLRSRGATERVTLDNGVRAFTPALEHFHDCILDGAAPLLTAADGVQTMRVIEAVQESAKSGQTVVMAG